MAISANEISKLRQQARLLKRKSELTHCQALDRTAQDQGFTHWKALIQSAGITDEVEVDFESLITPIKIPKSQLPRVFNRIQIESLVFTANFSHQGPYIVAMHGKEQLGGVSLGVSDMVLTAGKWCIAKYSSQPHINLSLLSDNGREALAYHFGFSSRKRVIASREFFNSPVFDSLVEWCRNHPTYAEKASAWSSTYLPDWHGRAMAKVMGKVYDDTAASPEMLEQITNTLWPKT